MDVSQSSDLDDIDPDPTQLSPEHRLQRALDAGGVGLWEIVPHRRLLYGTAATNAEHPQLHHVRMSFEAFIARVRPDHQDVVRDTLDAAIADGIPATVTYAIERPDGQVRWIEAHLYPEQTTTGAISRAVAITRDITDLRDALHTQEKLLASTTDARELAERTVRARNNFISSTVHDLRTPMTSIRGRTQLLLRRVNQMDLTDGDREVLLSGLDQIESGITHMNMLLGDLQDAAFLHVGKALELHMAPTLLGAIVESAIAEIHPVYPTHEINLTLEGKDEELLLDPLRMRRVMTNLLTNAAKYSPDHSTITVVVRHEPDETLVEVKDEGIGIPAAEIDHIFDRFFRAANAAGTNEGEGIGLASARQIVRQHGGEITVTSEVGRGSSFLIRLPANPTS